MELFEQNNIAVVGASFNSVEQNAAFAAKNAYNFPILCDTARTLGMASGGDESTIEESVRTSLT